VTAADAVPWLGLGLSVLVVVERVWVRANDRTREQVTALHRRLDELKSISDRNEGAQLLTRVAQLEQHQRADQQLLARIDQRLLSVDQSLQQIHATLERLP
jgi:hypothetical protein